MAAAARAYLGVKPVAYFGRFLGVDDRMHAMLSGVYGHPVHGNSTGEAITSRVHGIAYGADGEVERVETANTVYRRVPR